MDQTVVVKNSDLAGKGVFANKEFKRGEVVLRWHPKKISEDEAQKLPESEKHYINTSDGKYLYMQPPERYVNHSCEPNTASDGLADVAIRNITKGEEITSDYGNGGILAFKCNCGSKYCRGLVH